MRSGRLYRFATIGQSASSMRSISPSLGGRQHPGQPLLRFLSISLDGGKRFAYWERGRKISIDDQTDGTEASRLAVAASTKPIESGGQRQILGSSSGVAEGLCGAALGGLTR